MSEKCKGVNSCDEMWSASSQTRKEENLSFGKPNPTIDQEIHKQENIPSLISSISRVCWQSKPGPTPIVEDQAQPQGKIEWW